MKLDGTGYVVHTDSVVGVASVQVSTIGGPSEGSAVWHLGVFAGRRELNTNLIDSALALKIPDLNARGGSSHQPVAVR